MSNNSQSASLNLIVLSIGVVPRVRPTIEITLICVAESGSGVADVEWIDVEKIEGAIPTGQRKK